MPPLVRRQPLFERIKSYLDPYDFMLWLLEEINDDAFEKTLNSWALTVGVTLNIIFVLARSTSKSRAVADDDIFADYDTAGRNGWVAWISAFLTYLITILCCLNAYFVVFNSKRYRLFQQPIDIPPSASSARRVHVDNTDQSKSPWQYITDIIAQLRGHQGSDTKGLVWEISVWVPKAWQLTLFTLFSPGHLLLYFSILPARPLDPRPSFTVLLAASFGVILSLQLSMLKRSFEGQAKDRAVISGQVLTEYDIKRVRPSLNHLVRDVGVQTRESAISASGTFTREVDLYTPTGPANGRFSRRVDFPSPSEHNTPTSVQRSSDAGLRRRSDFVTPSTHSARYSLPSISKRS